MALLRTRYAWLLILAAVAVAAGLAARPYVRGASLVVHATDIEGWPQRLTGWQLRSVESAETTFASRHGRLPVRVYRPEGALDRTVVLTPGVHAGGFDEPRLVGLARDLAAHGFGVVSPDLPDLRDYRVTPRTTDMVEDAARWALGRPDLTPDGRIGFVGISFGGGLSVVAAGRDSMAGRVAAVLSFGGHGDFPRVLAYLCTGRLPDGRVQPPHDYGVVLILLGAAPLVVPPGQVDPLRHGIRIFLNASHLALEDAAAAAREFERARDYAETLPQPARRLMRAVNERDVATLGPILLPHVADYGADPALSPERSPAPAAPTYLLHGAGDTVIPAIESRLLADVLEPHTTVRLLVTPLITHAEVDRAAEAMDIWRLIAFWGDFVGE